GRIGLHMSTPVMGSPAGPSAEDVAALLGDWPARGSGSLAARLAFSLRTRILADLLPPGSVLPPERALAAALAVSRSTLVAAFDQPGLLALRAALAARHTAAGLPTGADEVHVTHGAQHAIDLALATLCGPGDAVAVEDPTYPGVLDVIAARGLRAVPLAGDARGPTPAALDDAARAGARVAFLLPAVHNPTGRVLDPGRRQALARALDRLDLIV